MPDTQMKVTCRSRRRFIAIITLFLLFFQHSVKTQSKQGQGTQTLLLDKLIARTFQSKQKNESIYKQQTSLDVRPSEKRLAEPRTKQNAQTQTPQNRPRTELVVESGHTFEVHSVAFSPDGLTLASGGDNTVRLWDMASGHELKTFIGHKDLVFSVTFSPDGKMLASGSRDDTIKLWDLQTGEEIKTLNGGADYISSVLFSPDGKMLASCGKEEKIKLWDIATGVELRGFKGHTGIVDAIAFSPDGTTLASADWNTFKLWDVASREERRTFTGHCEGAESVAFSPDGKVLVRAGGWEKTVKTWDVATGQELKTLRGHTDYVSSATFSPDGQVIASSSFDGTIKLWNAANGIELKTLAENADAVYLVVFSPDGETLASCGEDRTIKLWDRKSGKILRVLRPHTHDVESVVVSPDGKFLGIGGFDGMLKIWDVAKGNELKSLNGHRVLVQAIAFSPDSKFVASGSYDGVIKMWNVAKGEEIWSVDSGQEVEELYRSLEQKLKEKELDPNLIRTALHHSVYSIAFSPDGKVLAIVILIGNISTEIRLLDVETGRKLKDLDDAELYGGPIAFSPDGQTLAGSGKNRKAKFFGPEGWEVTLWDVTTGKKLRTLTGHTDQIDATAFSTKGDVLATASRDGTVRLWDWHKRKQLNSFPRDNVNTIRNVFRIAPDLYRLNTRETITPDGKLRIKLSENGRVNLKEVCSEKLLADLIVLDENDWVVISPSGRFDASIGAQKLMHFVVGLEPIDLEQIKDRYYEPGLLPKLIKHQSLRSVAPFTGDELYPAVKFEPLKQDKKSLTLHLKNRGGGIGAIQVFINGQEFIADARPVKFDSKQQEATLDIDLSSAKFLEGEENSVKVIVRNSAGWLRSRGSEFLYQAEGEKRADPPELYAIIGGVSEFEEGKLNLKYAAKDAEDFAHVLELGASKVFGRDKVHIRLLSSKEEPRRVVLSCADSKHLAPTKENFKQVFAEFRKAKSTDIFVIYLSGHGTSIIKGGDTGDTYLYLTQEAVTTNSARLLDEKLREATAISSDELVQWIKEVHTKKRAMILDTCAAGVAVNSFIAKRDITDEQTYQIRAIDRLKWLTGFYVLMSSAPNAQSYEATRYGQGLLTYSLLEALRGGGLQNQYAFVGQVFSYAVKRVPDIAVGNGLIQEPRIFTPDQSQDFFVGRFTEEEQKLFTLAKEKPLFLRPMFLNQNTGIDDLSLTSLLKISLTNASFVNSDEGEPQLVFVDADEMYDAITPSGQYEIEGDNVRLTVNLVRNKKVEARVTITGNSSDKNAMVQQLVKALIQAAHNLQD